jgi:hypothetical protein
MFLPYGINNKKCLIKESVRMLMNLLRYSTGKEQNGNQPLSHDFKRKMIHMKIKKGLFMAPFNSF